MSPFANMWLGFDIESKTHTHTHRPVKKRNNDRDNECHNQKKNYWNNEKANLCQYSKLIVQQQVIN